MPDWGLVKRLGAGVLALALGALAGGLASASADDPGNTPILELHLDTRSNTTVDPSGSTRGDTPDSSGHSLAAQAVGALETVTGRYGAHALATAVDGDEVSVGDNPVLHPARMTVMAWVKRSGPPGANRLIVGKGAGLGTGCTAFSYSISTGAGGGLRFRLTTDQTSAGHGDQVDSSTPELPPSSPVWDGSWHAVAGTYDGSDIKLWVDGVAVESAPVGDFPVRYGDGDTFSATLFAGFAEASHVPPCDAPVQFQGSLDEIRVYDRALNASEIGYLQNTDPAITTPPSLPPPVTTTTTGTTTTPSTTTTTPPPPPKPLPPIVSLKGKALVGQKGTLLDASGSRGALIFLWDLNGDHKTDIRSSASNPFLKLITPKAGIRTIFVTAVGPTGLSSTAKISIRTLGVLGGLKRLPESAALSNGPKIFIKSIGKKQSCASTTVVFQLVEARGCFTRETSASAIPERERAVAQGHYDSVELPHFVTILCTHAKTPKDHQYCDEFTADYKSLDFYVDHGTVKLNGLTITPVAGASVVVWPSLQRVISANATVKFGPMTVRSGAVDFNVKNTYTALRGSIGVSGRAPLLSFDGRRDLPDIGGFRLDAQVQLAVVAHAGQRFSEGTVHLKLPKIFSLFGGDPPSAGAAVAASNDRDLHFDNLDIKVPEANLGALRFTGLEFKYQDGGDSQSGCARHYWHASGNLFLGPAQSAPAGFLLTEPPHQNGVAFCDGGFKSAGGVLQFGGSIPSPQVFPGVFLDRVSFAIQLNPLLLRAGATFRILKIVTVDGVLLAAFATPSAPYTLTKGDAGPQLAPFAGRTFKSTTIAAGGTVGIELPFVGSVPLGNAAILYSFPSYVEFTSHTSVDAGPVTATGDLGGQFNFRTGQFQVNVSGDTCIRHFKFACIGGLAIFSSEGVVGCLTVKLLHTFHPGLGVHWSHPFPPEVWLPDGCKPSHFWVKVSGSGARAAAARPLTFTVARGERLKSLRLRGVGGAPKVRLRAPDGATLDIATEDFVNRSTMLGLRADYYRTTWFGVKDGKPGTYTITPLPGSVPFGALSETRPGYDSQFTARVTGAGARRTLHYDARKRGGGQKVVFYERGVRIFRRLATSRGGQGTLVFTPASGDGGVRAIVARASIDGIPIPDQVVAHYRAPATVRTGQPARVRLRRRGTSLLLSWTPAAGATSYAVVVERTDGAQRRFRVGARRLSLRVRGATLTQGARAGVTAQGALGDWGHVRHSNAVKAAKRATTVVQTGPEYPKPGKKR